MHKTQSTSSERFEVLIRLLLFRDVKQVELIQRVAEGAETFVCGVGQDILHEGAAGRDVFVVVDGLFQVVRSREANLLAYRGPMTPLGAHCAVDGLPHGFSTRAVVQSRVLRLGPTFKKVAVETPQVLLNLLRHVHTELEEEGVHRERMAKLWGEARLAAALLQVADAVCSEQRAKLKLGQGWEVIAKELNARCSKGIDLGWLTQEKLCDELGMGEKVLRTALRSLVQRGAVECPTRGTIRIVSYSQLVSGLNEEEDDDEAVLQDHTAPVVEAIDRAGSYEALADPTPPKRPPGRPGRRSQP